MTTDAPADATPTASDAQALAEQALDSANIANKVNEDLAKKLQTVTQEQKALGVLIHGLTKDKPGEAVKPSKLDHVLARLEALESSARGEITDYAPVIKELSERSGNLAGKVEALAAVVSDNTTLDNQMLSGLAEVQVQVDQLEARLARAEHDGTADTVGSDAHQALTEWTESQVNALGVQLNDLAVNYSRRLEDVESSINSLSIAVGQVAFQPSRPVAPGYPAMPVMGVHTKMLALMDEVTAISKDRRASGGGVSFKFRGVEDAQNAVGQAQRKVRILILPEVVSWEYGQEHVDTERDGKVKTVTWSTSRLTMRYVFVDPDDGSREVVTMVGEGKDNSDKSASKAASMACKYALFQALMIPFEDVDESDKQSDARAEHVRPAETPGARVNRGEISPEQAVQEYQQQAAPEMPPAEKAAALIRWVRGKQKDPGAEALAAVKKAMDKATANNLNELEVEGVPVRTHLTSLLQNTIAAMEGRTASGGAQGVTRQGQQTGEGARAATTPGRRVTQEEYDQANRVLANPESSVDAMEAALAVTTKFEAQITGGE